jgi:hypothetical protein
LGRLVQQVRSGIQVVLSGFLRPAPVCSSMIIIMPDPVIQQLDHLFFESHLGLNIVMVVMMAMVVTMLVVMVVVVMMGHNASFFSFWCGILTAPVYINRFSFGKL